MPTSNGLLYRRHGIYNSRCRSRGMPKDCLVFSTIIRCAVINAKHTAPPSRSWMDGLCMRKLASDASFHWTPPPLLCDRTYHFEPSSLWVQARWHTCARWEVLLLQQITHLISPASLCPCEETTLYSLTSAASRCTVRSNTNHALCRNKSGLSDFWCHARAWHASMPLRSTSA